ncbi:GNAT family N-acetyltransferase [Aliidiomarina soli]|uniref:GNAT family N-acetyltransferase n=1 Tax=Aliidiomarina soli TaxID=1928574 RepID=A0A432WLU1_9GAMM|nr:GNAT family N-acetyltransferase [Aliidiomarina soli]RUO34701.1 GNAT family N-acetyltransferase [Aliidiomarina soli]
MAHRFEFVTRISDIEPLAWDALFAPNDYPFTRHAFFQALEDGASIGGRSGWLPRYLCIYEDTDARLVAAAPFFIKLHSYGEYFFDWGIADAYAQLGLNYYPKLICAIPFTPCEGPRLGTGGQELEPFWPVITEALAALQDEYAFASQQLMYLPPAEFSSIRAAEDTQSSQSNQAAPWLHRTDLQFLWHNRGYSQFDDFLAALTSRKRKQLRKERTKVREQGIHCVWFTGEELQADNSTHSSDGALSQLQRHLVAFYQLTYLKRSGHHGYLTPETFARWLATMGSSIRVLMAFSESDSRTPVAMSFFFVGGDTLYGRYWGCLDEFDFLHFECCYYQGIDYCIEHGLRYFDAGAQGEHKLARGFEPMLRHGYFSFALSASDPTSRDLRLAIEDFCQRERTAHQQALQQATTYLPFRRDSD